MKGKVGVPKQLAKAAAPVDRLKQLLKYILQSVTCVPLKPFGGPMYNLFGGSQGVILFA